jgi:hypothetical protein
MNAHFAPIASNANCKMFARIAVAGFMPRPIRPATKWRPGLSVTNRPPSTKRGHLSYSLDDIAKHSARIRGIPPEKRRKAR